LWLGTAPWRPYKENWPEQEGGTGGGGGGRRRRNGVYQPFAWRGWQDFGTGALGDMACHTVNWPFRALKLGYPTEIEAESSGMNKEMYPKNSKIRFEFPAREGLPAVTLWWSDGGNKPPKDVTASIVALRDEVSGSGCLLIGEKGELYSPDDGDGDFNFFLKLKDEKELVSARQHQAVSACATNLVPRNEFRGAPDQRQHLEWIAACKGGKPGYSDFAIAGYLTEIILLGCVALRTGKKLDWDGPKMRAKNAPEAAQYVKREYRKGWKL
jgi:predicted dehydrogenase